MKGSAMPGIGISELIALSLLVLFLFSPRELPLLARKIARGIYAMKHIFHRLEKEWQLLPEFKKTAATPPKPSSKNLGTDDSFPKKPGPV